MANPIQILEKLNNIKIGLPSSVLACETDGCVLRAAVVHTGTNNMEIEAVAESRALDFQHAVADVVAELKNQVKRLPNKAILVSPSAVGALIELPVNPAKPRADAQMQELIRWELEPLFAQQNEIWSIGSLLMGRGYINAEQRQQVVDDLHGRGASGSRLVNVRFGEVALDLGFVTREQVGECLALQEKLVMVDDELVCGWAPQVSDDISDDEESGPFYWYSLGIGRGMCNQWAKAFRASQIFLSWIYPQIGSAFVSLEQSIEQNNGDQLLLELRQEQMAVIRGQAGQLASLQVVSTSNGLVDVDDVIGLCQEQLRPDFQKLHLFAPTQVPEALTQRLSEQFEREVVNLPLPEIKGDLPKACSANFLASIAGAAAHHLGRSAENSIVRVRAQAPKPPIWKRKELYPYMATAAVLLCVIGVDASIHFKRWQNTQKLNELNATYEEKLDIKKKFERTVSEARHLEKQLQENTEQLEGIKKQQRLVKDVLLYRQQSIPGILEALARSTSDEVIIDSIIETEKQGGLRVHCWALTDTGAELFLNKLNKAVTKWGLRVEGAQVAADRGRLGLDGYGITLWLIAREAEGEV